MVFQALPVGSPIEKPRRNGDKKAPCSSKRRFTWLNEDRRVPQRLELACTRFLTLVPEIPSIFEYIDFGRPRDIPRDAKIGRYPERPGIGTRRTIGIITHRVGGIGSNARNMALSVSCVTYTRAQSASE